VVKGESANDWLASADKHESSWWTDWAKWIAPRAGAMVAPYRLPAGEAAPGPYVKNEVGKPYDPLGVAARRASRAGAHVARNGASKSTKTRKRTPKQAVKAKPRGNRR
jgi:polyhydroxyalkanoate synthase